VLHAILDSAAKLNTKWESGKDEWKKTRKLGSLLGEEEDIQRRMQLAMVQFKNLQQLWRHSRATTARTRIRLYKALVIPILTYNAGTWEVRRQCLDKLDIFHRKQLREVLGIRWPERVSNCELYDRCDSVEVSTIVKKARWSLFGHVLRLNANTPAQLAMDYYCRGVEAGEHTNEARKRGRAKANLPVTLFNEYHALKQAEKTKAGKPQSNYRQKDTTALKELRKCAQNREQWRKLSDKVAGILEE
jgi:hypothetical protein